MIDFATQRRIMVDTQVRPSDVTSFDIIEAMLEVPRELFVPDNLRQAAYAGETLEIAKGRYLLEPRTFAKMLEALDIGPDELVLDLAVGLGYSSAVIARLAEAVVAVEADPELAAEAQRILSQTGADNVAVITAEPASGAPRHGPYDAVIIEGGVEEIPAALVDQLKEGGRICAIFMDGEYGECRVGHKRAGVLAWRPVFHAAAPVLAGFERQPEFAL
ncbi:protein-L-isoaspartate(D-aspartate) O-methyltransferase [Meinhardsimonia xiamenensis]|jgi:protein-L-isoaspartate(D-aspartate) O-methyltransferase|uniref:Protein-L-isoaspartate O-methyltransferase n=1 Tax=Meinhardsimonia xiamenensis TaxID=990712 RepID=A0A1G9B4H2_9RHOB|nr:protein-L-isoaspartate O-methyltransferase [Meinhardsimonia xiamenensis]PRX35125.1 protein-L-isoaspartate(D-aspartate) O-methyltransferase [Meinhardsimonia xiamenensis]SDK34398.1 protein-L-isoaspartate(D-aspartate) O-methyltransferase [Meinhardsimonia xiamenensis]